VQAVLFKKYHTLNEQAILAGDLGAHGYGIHAVREGKAGDTWVRIRGVEERHGPKVPRGFPRLIRSKAGDCSWRSGLQIQTIR